MSRISYNTTALASQVFSRHANRPHVTRRQSNAFSLAERILTLASMSGGPQSRHIATTTPGFVLPGSGRCVE